MDGDNAIGALALAIENLLIANQFQHRQQSGRVSVGSVAGNAGASMAVTFAAGRFTQTPIVTTAAVGAGYGASGHAGASTTGVTIRGYNPQGSGWTISVDWHAIQALAGSGPGGLTIEPMAAAAYVVTCHTEGCENAGVPMPVAWDADIDGPEVRAVCGVCGEPITDTAAA